MNLDEFRAHIEAQRNTSKAEALSALTAKIVNNKTEKENK